MLQVYFEYTSSILQVYFNLLNYRRSILQVHIISTNIVAGPPWEGRTGFLNSKKSGGTEIFQNQGGRKRGGDF